LCALLAGPGIVLVVVWMWEAGASAAWMASLGIALLLYAVLVSIVLQEKITHRLRTLSSVVSALREEDYSFRARGTRTMGAFGELAAEINLLADTFQQQRTQTIETTALLAKIVETMDAPLFAFDLDSRLRIINPAGERFLGKTAAASIGVSAEELGMDSPLWNRDESIVTFGSNLERWLLRSTAFRQGGLPHRMLVLLDVSTPLQEEERLAWQRLIRVLGHELSNSLAPIKSIAESLAMRVESLHLDEQMNSDFLRGLGVIKSRAEALHRFVEAYRTLTQLPPPVRTRVSVRALLERVVSLETRVRIHLQGGPEVTLLADSDQLEQMFINLLRNAVEASMENSSNEVTVRWCCDGASVIIDIDDRGRGIANRDNLFVPFYTTKPNGNGVGLVLARQIVLAHSGRLYLEANHDGVGTRAEVVLPL
jgi:nitrogen fixation/metabolism regulation signal transduction histidine kinase